jgi:hypothetical protein
MEKALNLETIGGKNLLGIMAFPVQVLAAASMVAV